MYHYDQSGKKIRVSKNKEGFQRKRVRTHVQEPIRNDDGENKCRKRTGRHFCIFMFLLFLLIIALIMVCKKSERSKKSMSQFGFRFD
jgi:hypothetical protein